MAGSGEGGLAICFRRFAFAFVSSCEYHLSPYGTLGAGMAASSQAAVKPVEIVILRCHFAEMPPPFPARANFFDLWLLRGSKEE
jgi:hypothetical protein